jgi:hypothetical protein
VDILTVQLREEEEKKILKKNIYITLEKNENYLKKYL